MQDQDKEQKVEGEPQKISLKERIKKIAGMKYSGLVAGIVLVAALAIGWQVQLYIERQNVIKTTSEPAAALKRDDTAKPLDPKLFTKLNYSVKTYTQDGERRGHVEMILSIDENACRSYYGGREGVVQCRNNWDFLTPEEDGWKISPDLGGKWTFQGDGNRYTARYDFLQDDLKAGQKYELSAPKKLGKDVELAKYEASMSTAAFELNIRSWNFRVDPQNPKRCILTGEVSSPYRIDPESFEKNLSFEKVAPLELGSPELIYSKDGTIVTVNMDALSLPQESTPVRLQIGAGVRRQNSNEVSSKNASSGVTVPGVNVFVSLAQASAFITTDDELLSRQVLNLEFTRPVKVSDVQRDTKAISLPKYLNDEDRKKNRPANWSNYDISSKAVRNAINASDRKMLELTPIYTPDEYSTVVSFIFSTPPGYFYLDNAGGAASVTDYKLASFRRVMSVPRLEPELRIMQEGNILSLNASKTLALFSRGMKKVYLKAYRVRPEYVNLLATQSSEYLANTQFDDYNSLGFYDVSEELWLSYKPIKVEGNEPDYHALDLSPLLKGGAKGMFRIELMGRSNENNSLSTYRSTFLLVTDLAMNIKQSPGGERQVFVSSFANGTPLSGVRIEVIGRNGLPVFAKATDATGSVQVPSVEGFKNEKRPVAIVARSGNDFTYIPFSDYSRRVSFDNFPDTFGRKVEVGGMSAFVFAERGMFRPGEELRFGAIVKASDWNNAKIKGLPVRAVLTNPRGTVVYDKQLAQDESGLLSITIPMQETDPTGRYNLDVSVDKKLLGSTQVQVEEFQPDNLKVTAGFNKVPATGLKKGWVLPDDLKAIISVQNLYGTPAVENNVDMSFTLTPVRLAFSQHSDYRFFDPGANTRSYQSDMTRQQTNEKGEAEFSLGMDNYASGSYRLSLDAQAFEKGGGRGVSASTSLLISPHKVLIGWKSEAKLNFIGKDSKADVAFIAVDNTLERTSFKDLKLVISEVEYVASLIKDSSGRYRYDKVRRLKEVQNRTINVPESGINIALPTQTTGEFELSLMDEGGLERCNLNYVVAGGSQRRFGLERDATLRVHLDKLEYQADEDMKIFISAPYAGSGLITLESDKVHAHKWFTATTSDSIQSIKVPPGFESRAFVNVSMVRDITSDAVHSTPFSYAVAPFIANIEKRNLKLKVDSPERVQPGETLRMTVSAEKPGKAVVFAVNEGILQLTNFRTPSPLTYFLKQNPLSVSTMQNWDMIMPEYYLMNMAAFGGDYAAESQLAGQLNPFRRKAEPSVVYWSGLVDVGPDGTVLEWEVPAYFNGSLRIMAMGAGALGIGESSRNTTVRGPLIITPDLPVAVAPGDEFEVTAAIANNVEDSGTGLKISVEVELDEGLTFMRKAEPSITVDEGREGKAVFRLKATNKLGESIVKITTRTEFNGQEIVVTRPVSLSVRPASPRMSSFKAGFVKGKEQTVMIGRQLYPEFDEVEASVSGLPLPMMDGLSGFLTRFPHGCTEQTLSAAFPYAILNKSPELLPVPRGMTPAMLKDRSDKAIQNGLVTMRERQVVPGRFSLWPYEAGGYSFLTVYGLDYLMSAKEAGFKVPDDLIRDAQRETLSLLQSTPHSLEAMRTMSYAAWVYTRSGQRYTGLPRLVKDLDQNIKDWRSTPSAALIAACYQIMQQDKEAAEIMKSVKAIDPADKKQRGYSGWFYNRLWDNSLLLSVFSRHFPEMMDSLEAKKVLVHVINDVAGSYYTTSSAVQAVRGISDYAAANMGKSPSLELVALNGKQVLPNEAIGELVKRLSMGNEATDFRFAGAEGLYWQITTDGFDLKPQPAQAKKLVIKSRFIPAKGQSLEELQQGDEVYVLLTASSTDNIDNIAITSLIPGGFEMVISKGGQIVGGGANGPNQGYSEEDYYEDPDEESDDYVDPDTVSWNMDSPVAYPNQAHMRDVQNMLREAGLKGVSMDLVHVERREDRMILYTSLSSQERVFIFRIKAINKGKFTLPSTFAEALYDPDARANTAAGEIEVK